MNKYKLVVSEPWNFESERRDNQLSGYVVKKIDEGNLLFEADEQVIFSGIRSRYWILSTRYENQCFDAEPYQGTVNGGLLAAVPSKSDGILEIKKQAVFSVIGSLQPD